MENVDYLEMKNENILSSRFSNTDKLNENSQKFTNLFNLNNNNK